MKTGWAIGLATLALVLGAAGGSVLGGVGGAVGGSLAGVCHTADIAVKEGLLTEAQKSALLQAMSTKYAEQGARLKATGDLALLCKDMPRP